jgi:hypothetical protein
MLESSSVAAQLATFQGLSLMKLVRIFSAMRLAELILNGKPQIHEIHGW